MKIQNSLATKGVDKLSFIFSYSSFGSDCNSFILGNSIQSDWKHESKLSQT